MERICNLLPERSLDDQRRFFGCQQWSDEDLDGFVGILQVMPDGKWLKTVTLNTRRIFAMSCIALKEKDPEAFKQGIALGKMWTSS
jgi:hypothetical protein